MLRPQFAVWLSCHFTEELSLFICIFFFWTAHSSQIVLSNWDSWLPSYQQRSVIRAASIRLCSRCWWDSGALSPELCTQGARSHCSRAQSDGRSCCRKPAEERRRRCGPSRCCRCWCCPVSARPKCWGTRRRTAAHLGRSDGDGASTTQPTELWWPRAGPHSQRQPTWRVLSPSPHLSEDRKRKFKGQATQRFKNNFTHLMPRHGLISTC